MVGEWVAVSGAAHMSMLTFEPAEGREVQGAGERMSVKHSSGKPGYSPPQLPPFSPPPPGLLNPLPPWVHCLLPSPCPPPRPTLSHTLVRSRVRRRLGVGKQD